MTIKCAICGKELNQITSTHLRTHKLTMAEYRAQYPDALLIDPEIGELQKAKASNSGKANKGKTAWNKGVARTEEQNRHLSEVALKQYTTGERVHWNVGNVTPDEVKRKISETLKSQNRRYASASLVKRTITLAQKVADGWIWPSCRPEVVEKRKQTAFDRYGVTNKMMLKVPEHVRALLDDKDWLYEQHITMKKPLTAICETLGLHWKNGRIVVVNRLRKHGIEQQYYVNQSQPERDLYDWLTSKGFDVKQNVRGLIGRKELDLYIPALNLAIEYCGLLYHSELYIADDYHYNKLQQCERLGIRLITLFEDEWLNNKELVLTKLSHILGISEQRKVYARKTVCCLVEHGDKETFLNDHHIQGSGPGSFTVGLKSVQELVAVMTFINNGNGEYTLNRYATSCNVVGGMSKLIAFAKRCMPDMVSIITFADRRWSCGDVYERTGFVEVGQIPPDYRYFNPQERVTYHKFGFRHKFLQTKFGDNYNPDLSEHENCYNNKMYRVYNCGLIKYQLTLK